MDEAKIRLSPKEMDLVKNADWILTKNNILDKVMLLLGELCVEQEKMLEVHRNGLPTELFEKSAKISKGERYRGLPYLILDYPRVFNKENVFAIRTMFWWGHFFSITLQLSGNYKNVYQKRILKYYDKLKEQQFFIASGENEWEHHFENDYYRSLQDINKEKFEGLILEKPFIKLANNLSLQQWDNMIPLLSKQYGLLLQLISE